MTRSEKSFGIPEAPIFCPTVAEFSDPLKYIANLVHLYKANEYGIIKIIPPAESLISAYGRLEQAYIKFKPRLQVLNELSVQNRSLMFLQESKRILQKRKVKKTPLWNDIFCVICGKGDNETKLMLCDECDGPYHTYCLDPPVDNVFKGSFFCFTCRQQKISGAHGFENSDNEFTLDKFHERAERYKRNHFNRPLCTIKSQDVENEFWRLIACKINDIKNRNVVEYGADLTGVSGFLSDCDPVMEGCEDESSRSSAWNLHKLPLAHESALRYVEGNVSGMKSPWSYAGTCFSCFCWHVEDHWTYSINYLHKGDCKTWYGIPSSDADKFEAILREAAPEYFYHYPYVMHNLNTIYDPRLIQKAGVRIYRMDQCEGEIMITFPRAYHAGFNQGFNFAEAVNFCTPDWLPMGRACIDAYVKVRRCCVFSHNELCVRIAEDLIRQGELALEQAEEGRYSLTTLEYAIVEIRTISARLIDNLTVATTSFGFADVDTAVKETSCQKPLHCLSDNDRSCIVCNTTLYEIAVTCACQRERFTCVSHCNGLCSCPVDNIKKRLYVSCMPEFFRRLISGLEDLLMQYNAWKSDIHQIRAFWSAALVAEITNRELHDIKSEGGDGGGGGTTVEEVNVNGSGSEALLEKLTKSIDLKTENIDDERLAKEKITPSDCCSVTTDVCSLPDPTGSSITDMAVMPTTGHVKAASPLRSFEYFKEHCTLEHLRVMQLKGKRHDYPEAERTILDSIVEFCEQFRDKIVTVVRKYTTVDEMQKVKGLLDSTLIPDESFFQMVHQLKLLPFCFGALESDVHKLYQEVVNILQEFKELNLSNHDSKPPPISHTFDRLLEGQKTDESFQNYFDLLKNLNKKVSSLPLKFPSRLFLEEELKVAEWFDRVRILFRPDASVKNDVKILHLKDLKQLIIDGRLLPANHSSVTNMLEKLNSKMTKVTYLNNKAVQLLRHGGSCSPIGKDGSVDNVSNEKIELPDLRSFVTDILNCGVQSHSFTQIVSIYEDAGHIQHEIDGIRVELLHYISVSNENPLFHGISNIAKPFRSQVEECIHRAEASLVNFTGLHDLRQAVSQVSHTLEWYERLLVKNPSPVSNGHNNVKRTDNDWDLLSILLPRPQKEIFSIIEFQKQIQGKVRGKLSLKRLLHKETSTEKYVNAKQFEEYFLKAPLSENLLRSVYAGYIKEEEVAMQRIRAFNRSRAQGDDSTVRYCLCSTTFDEKPGDMVECELCSEWFHYKCVGIPANFDAKNFLQTFLCPLCERSTRPNITDFLQRVLQDPCTPGNVKKNSESVAANGDATGAGGNNNASISHFPHHGLLNPLPCHVVEQVALRQLLERASRFKQNVHELGQYAKGMEQTLSEVITILESGNASVKHAGGRRSEEESQNRKVLSSSSTFYRIKGLKKVLEMIHFYRPFANRAFMKQIENKVVEGSLLEITCVEARAVALLFQCIQLVTQELESNTDPDNQSSSDQEDTEGSLSRILSQKATDGKSKQTTARPSNNGPLNQDGTTASKRGRRKKNVGAVAGSKPIPLKKVVNRRNSSSLVSQSETNSCLSDTRKESDEALFVQPDDSANLQNMSKRIPPKRKYMASGGVKMPYAKQSKSSNSKKLLKRSSELSDNEDIEECCALGHHCQAYKLRCRNVGWIECDGCLQWYHLFCVGFTDERLPEQYSCPSCCAVEESALANVGTSEEAMVQESPTPQTVELSKSALPLSLNPHDNPCASDVSEKHQRYSHVMTDLETISGPDPDRQLPVPSPIAEAVTVQDDEQNTLNSTAVAIHRLHNELAMLKEEEAKCVDDITSEDNSSLLTDEVGS